MARVLSRDLVPEPWNWHWPLLLPAVGRRLNWRMGSGGVAFTLQSLAAVPGWAGRFRSVRITAVDVDVGDVRLEHALVVARDVRLGPATVFARSVELTVRLGQQSLDGMLAAGLPYAKLHLADGVGRAELATRPGWGHVELHPSADDGGLLLEPAAVITRAGSRWTAPARALPRLRISADVLLPGSRLVDARVEADHLHLVAALNDVELPLFGRPSREPEDGTPPPDRSELLDRHQGLRRGLADRVVVGRAGRTLYVEPRERPVQPAR